MNSNSMLNKPVPQLRHNNSDTGIRYFSSLLSDPDMQSKPTITQPRKGNNMPNPSKQ
jgi:hypothetical protein